MKKKMEKNHQAAVAMASMINITFCQCQPVLHTHRPKKCGQKTIAIVLQPDGISKSHMIVIRVVHFL